MRLVRISLATKYRLLFGLAVLLIIGAALAVPWYYMEAIVLQQPFREARSVAEGYFRHVLPQPEETPTEGFHSGRFGLLPDAPPPVPTFARLTSDVNDPLSVAQRSLQDPFVDRAFRTLRSNPTSRTYYETTWAEDRGREFRYAHAVWVTRQCVDCHAEGGFARPYRENQLAGLILVDLPAEQSRLASQINRVVIVAAGTLAGILAILVFYLITTRFILAPINELRTVTLRVSDGDLAVRSNVQTGDEFEQLSENLNQMLERLRASQEELRRANRLLDEKLGEMAETNIALYEANRLKSEFLANVSHELRTPLTSIIGFAELLRESPPGTHDTKSLRYAENILISGRILLEIINDLLDLAKIEAGKVEVRREPIVVAALLNTLCDHVRPLADRRKLQLALEVPEPLPNLQSDAGKLRQIVYNLVSNAIKFTPEGGLIRLRAERDGDTFVRLLVSDTGPGIAPEHHDLIFEKFRQIDQSATREHHGTGLGLAIARELTTILGGTIGVESEVGRGATFWVRLPTVAPETTDRPPTAMF
ncbi:MAG: HAMP domain-containing protein [Phycisphaerales bacterium]|nr:HAMP domain-containing protein [Phycisphaerales bacterium]